MGTYNGMCKALNGSLAETTSDKQPSTYVYSTLPHGQSIRMLMLDAGEDDDPLIGRLELANINSLGSYEGLSYVWKEPGPTDAQHQIFLRNDDGESERVLELTGSLFAALRRVRLPNAQRRVWADQVCINQKDLEERSQQVQFMNLIYKNANHILVWLGLDENGAAELAFKLVKRLDDNFNDDAGRKILHARFTKNLEKQTGDEWHCLNRLTKLAWFNRGWVAQEIGTKAPATMFWGATKIDWTMLHTVCERLTDYHHLRTKFGIGTSQVKFFFQRFVEPAVNSYHANRFNLLYELHRARGLDFTDQRDRVFAWLGHYSIHSPNSDLKDIGAHYNKTVEEVYTDLAKRCLKGDKGGSSLMTLACVQHESLPYSRTARNPANDNSRLGANNTLPTWVPDWRTYQSFILSEPINPHRAHGTSSSRLAFVGERRLRLRIHGLTVDTLDACSRPLKAKEFHYKYHDAQTELTCQRLWRDICKKDLFNHSDKYLNGQSDFYAFMQTLSNGCVQIAGREGTPYREIPESRWLEQAAMYIAEALGQSETVTPELRQVANKAAGEQKAEEWSRSANGASKNRIFARTKKGYYVLGPKLMEDGDLICVLFGGKVPFCLRPWGDRFLLVGECYVHGLMDGEAMHMMSRQELEETVFEIV